MVLAGARGLRRLQQSSASSHGDNATGVFSSSSASRLWQLVVYRPNAFRSGARNHPVERFQVNTEVASGSIASRKRRGQRYPERWRITATAPRCHASAALASSLVRVNALTVPAE